MEGRKERKEGVIDENWEENSCSQIAAGFLEATAPAVIFKAYLLFPTLIKWKRLAKRRVDVVQRENSHSKSGKYVLRKSRKM